MLRVKGPRRLSPMHYRLATIDDLREICNMIEAAKQLMSEQGIEQWDDIYPACEDKDNW